MTLTSFAADLAGVLNLADDSPEAVFVAVVAIAHHADQVVTDSIETPERIADGLSASRLHIDLFHGTKEADHAA